jgi:hypothetical protein
VDSEAADGVLGVKPTSDEILAEPAGDRLDAWVAEFVMGWEHERGGHSRPLHRASLDYPGRIIDDWGAKGEHEYLHPPDDPVSVVSLCDCPSTIELPEFSRSISAAWEVVEKLMERWQVHITSPWSSKARWCVKLDPMNEPDDEMEVLGSTAPLAICRAALRTVIGSRDWTRRHWLTSRE